MIVRIIVNSDGIHLTVGRHQAVVVMPPPALDATDCAA